MSLTLRPALRAVFVTMVAAIALVLAASLVPAKANAAALVPGTKVFGTKVLIEAAKHRHDQYVRGGTGPHRFDCSGFTRYVIAKATGKKLPRTAAAQYRATKKISKKSVKPGDLIFFRHGTRVYHAAIYAGGGKIWHASNPRADIKLAKIWTSSWVASRVR
jgi:cell wall-associated NlpC family hydrolase